MDDGGGFMVSWEAVRVLNSLGVKPKRTIRAVVWVNEENGDAGISPSPPLSLTTPSPSPLSLGGLQYLEDGLQSGILVNHSIVIETDGGIFQPLGLGISCAETSNGGCGMAIAQLETLAPLVHSIGGDIVTSGGGGSDIDPSCQTGIVCAGWNVLDPRLSSGSSLTNNPCTVDSMGAWDAPVFDPYTQTMYDSGYFWFHHSDADTMERIDASQLNANAASLAIWTYAIAQLPELLPRNEAAPPVSDDDDSHGNGNGGNGNNKRGKYLIYGLAIGGGILAIFFIGLYIHRVRVGKKNFHDPSPSPADARSDAYRPLNREDRDRP
jgi:carboxypeptidase Q